MDLHDIESKLLDHTYTAYHDYDYPGYTNWRGETSGGHKKGDPYTVEMDEWYHWESVTDGIDVPGIGRVTAVEDIGGEGQGDYMAVILRIEPEDGSPSFLVRKEGYYSSYDGSEWDGDFSVVEPVEKTITVYEAV